MSVQCPECERPVHIIKGKIRNHLLPDAAGTVCEASGSKHEERCDSTEPANSATSTPRSADSSPSESIPPMLPSSSPGTSGGSFATLPNPRTGTIPGVEEYTEALNEKRQPLFSQPASPFSQPKRPAKVLTEAKPMTELGKRVTAELKQLFYQYNNRKTEDNRSAQTTIGPSEIGTPCDRRLAMSLMRWPAVNPGGDGWAAFVGTAIHAELAAMLQWADGGQGRYAVEQRLELPSVFVPKGTGDWLDRVLLFAGDHKGMGQWSLDKLKTDGPSPTYRVQVHTYAYGYRLRGEKIEHVAIIAWPRDKSSLDDLYVWTEPYNPDVARQALQRVDSLASWVIKCQEDGASHIDVAQWAKADNSDCRFCPFHMPGAKALAEGGGCNSRQ